MHPQYWITQSGKPVTHANPTGAGISKNELKKWNKEMRRAVWKDKCANKEYYKNNKRLIHLANEGKYITIHKNDFGEIVVVADETEEAREKYLETKLSRTVKNGAYVHEGRLEEYVDEMDSFDFGI